MPPSPLVIFDNVDVELAGNKVLHGITWQLMRGEHWGVVGANGSGKSTLLRLIAGTLWPAPDSGTRRYDFGRGEQSDAVQAREEIVLVSHELQDRYAHWGWNFSALDIVLSGVYRTDVPRRRPEAAERSRALAVMRRLGVVHLAQRRFLELSRGEQRRVLIARGVAFEPTVLLLDEPASGLDQNARAELASMLELVAEHLTLVCTAHVADDLPPAIERLLLIEHGRITVLEAADETATAARPDDSPAGSAGHAHYATQPVRESRADVAPLVELEHVNVWLGARQVLKDLNWRLEHGQQWLVTGANGSGKSSFLRLLHGQLRPALGSELRWPALGNPRNIWTLRRQVAWVSPELQAGYRYPTTVRACIASGFESSIGQTRALRTDEAARVKELLEQLELEPLAGRQLASLSYGQARRALIARALVNRPRLLLLDEPWEGLDASVAALFNRMLATIVAHGTQLVCASHLSTHRQHFTHELVLVDGRLSARRLSPSA